jgi:hypothetical protein
VSLEGPLRELGLQEVCQLLSLSRKTGVLHVRHGRRAWRGVLAVEHGAIVFAAVPGLVFSVAERLLALDLLTTEQLADARRGEGDWSARVQSASRVDRLTLERHALAAVESAIDELFTWRDGDFHFAPSEALPPEAATVRLSTDSAMMTAITRADQWTALSDRIAHAGMIPTFVEVEPVQLPLLHLVPQEWEVLTRVDGVRDLRALALVLERDALDVARVVHGLVAAGMLSLRDVVVTERAAPTPPSVPVIAGEAEWDAPELTPAAGRPAVTSGADGLDARAAQAARHGDFAGARAFWHAYLAARPWADDADRIREAIELVTRLESLLSDRPTLLTRAG